MTFSRCFLVAAMVFAVACGGRAKSVDTKPIADFKFTQSLARPQVFVFDAAESRPTVGTIAKYRWLFGDEADGAPTTDVTVANAQHAYKMAGTFTVTLVVEDDKGTASDPFTKMVTVTDVNTAGPMAMISGPTSGQPSMQLTFDGTASTPANDIQNYAWDFGDGQNTAGKDKTIVQHAFTTANRFRVTLTVTDSLGQNSTAELQVAVGDVGPLAVCTWAPMPALQGVPVNFNGSQSVAPSGSSIMLYVWDFGDGSQMSLGAMSSHTYNVQTTFHPKLKVLDQQNRSNETLCPDVVVGPPPLCNGDYSLTANPSSQNLCGLGNSMWAGSKLTITQAAGGTISSSEAFGTQTITYAGTWAGSTFMMTGTYDTTSMGLTDHHNVTINGTWMNGCGGWTGTYRETVTGDIWDLLMMPQGCTITWNITSTRL